MQSKHYLKNKVGQTLVVVLLVMSVIVTIALAVTARSITDVNISTKEEEAARAFSAAETGIEQALIGGLPTGTLSNASTFSVTTRTAGGSSGFNSLLSLRSSETASIWFVSHDDRDNLTCGGSMPCFTGNKIKLCWGNPDAPISDSAAVQLNVLYDPDYDGDYSNAGIARVLLDPNTGRTQDNYFKAASNSSCVINGINYAYTETIEFSKNLGITCASNKQCLLVGKIRFYYNPNPEPFGVDTSGSGSSLPPQGKIIESSGVSGEANRKVQVVRQYPDLPPIFDFALFSGTGDINK